MLVWLVQQLDKFPRSRRFTLGERIETRVIHVLELLTEAAYSREKRALLKRANIELAIIRHLWRTAHELSVISTRRYEHGSRQRVSMASPSGLSRMMRPNSVFTEEVKRGW